MESIEEVIYPALGLMFLLLGIVLIISIIFSAFSPYDQIAFANAEKMKSAIENACLNQGNVVKLKSLELRQNIPPLTWAFSILPRWMIRTGGDPNYILYYESYPPGDAVGWEVYHPFDTRLIVQIPDDREGMNTAEIDQYAKDSYDKFTTDHPEADIDSVTISNIMLSEKFKPNYIVSSDPVVGTSTSTFSSGGEVKTDTREEKFFALGKWDVDKFKFDNYLGLALLDKTAIKYQACGANSLCLKTRNGVYRFPLENCDSIKNIQLVYDARLPALSRYAFEIGAIILPFSTIGAPATVIGRIAQDVVKGTGIVARYIATRAVKYPMVSVNAAGGVLALEGSGATHTISNALGTVSAAFMGLKTMDFAITSPCLLGGPDDDDKIEIIETTCDEVEIAWSANYPACSRYIKAPIYEYDETAGLTYTKVGSTKKYHYTCTEKIGWDTENGFDTPPDDNEHTYNDADLCIQVRIPSRAKSFCWTADPWKEGTSGTWLSGADTILLTGLFGMTPIKESSAFVSADDNVGPMIVLKPSDDKELQDYHDMIERKLVWGWP